MADDSPENVLIVPVVDYAFRRAREDHVYAFPAGSNKRVKEYLALYRSKPVGAITHYAPVASAGKGEIDLKYRAICFGDRVDAEPMVVRLDRLDELEQPVESTDYGIQGQMYTTLDRLLDAETLEDLSET